MSRTYTVWIHANLRIVPIPHVAHGDVIRAMAHAIGFTYTHAGNLLQIIADTGVSARFENTASKVAITIEPTR